MHLFKPRNQRARQNNPKEQRCRGVWTTFPSSPRTLSKRANGGWKIPFARRADAQSNPADPGNPNDQYGKQPKRILGIIPNYRAVSANTHLPPQSFKNNLWLATEDTFDYSDFIFVGGLAGIAMAGKSQPSFGQGAAGYGRYYWHIFLTAASRTT